MAITKDKKAEVLEKLNEIAGKNSIVFVNFHGLPVSDVAEMRKKLHNAGVSYTVAKKTLMRKAFGESKITGDMPELEGEIAVAYSDDLIDAAREIYTFQKDFEDRIQIVGGVFEGAYRDKDGMIEIANIPSQEQLYGMFVNVINSPIQGFVMTLKALAEKREEAEA